MKKKIIMLAGHEPSLDPRVDWEGCSAAISYDVTVLGLHDCRFNYSDIDESKPYKIIRYLRRNTFPNTKKAILSLFFPLLKKPKLVLFSLILAPLFLTSIIIYDLIVIFIHFFKKCIQLIFSKKLTFYIAKKVIYKYRFFLKKTFSKLEKIHSTIWLLRHFFCTAETFYLASFEQTKEPEIIHANDLDTLLAAVLLKMRWNNIPRIVYDSHEYYPYSDPNAPWYRVCLFRWMERTLIKFCDKVITVSPPLGEALKKDYNLPEIIIIPNAEPWGAYEQQKPSKTKMSLLAAERVKFLFQGNFAPKRGLEEIIQCWKHIDSTKAALFLRGPDSPSRQELEKLADKLGLLDKSVFFLPAVKEDELVVAAKEADIGLIPYKADCLGYRYACPNKLSQYMHAGLGILANSIPYVKLILQEGQCGKVYDIKEPNTFIEQVNALLKDINIVQSLKQSSLHYGKETFNWQNFSKDLIKIYRECEVA